MTRPRRPCAWRCARSPWRHCPRRPWRCACREHRRVGPRKLVSRHEVHAGEILIGGIDALEVLARDIHKDRQSGAIGDENGVKLLPQFLQRVGSADNGVADNFDPGLFQPATSASTIFLGRRNSGNAIDQNAARFMERLEYRDRVAEPDQLARGGEAAGAGPDDGHLFAGRGPAWRVAVAVCHGPNRRHNARDSRSPRAGPCGRGCIRLRTGFPGGKPGR